MSNYRGVPRPDVSWVLRRVRNNKYYIFVCKLLLLFRMPHIHRQNQSNSFCRSRDDLELGNVSAEAIARTAKERTLRGPDHLYSAKPSAAKEHGVTLSVTQYQISFGLK